MGWIQTYTGRKIDPTNMNASEVWIEDIAHALAMKCRYASHCPEFYSVAQHSILVAQNVPPKDALWALLHDGCEAYIPDLASPVKRTLRSSGVGFWDDLESRVERVVFERFGLFGEVPASVKEADILLLATEARSFFGGTVTYSEWQTRPENGFKTIAPSVIQCWDWRSSELAFLKAFALLTDQNNV